MNNPEPFLSIVIPVYNVEEYLERCIESILTQSFDDWEMIIINDCSPDQSQKIIDRYVLKDGRIKSVINKKNRGLGATRNIGIKHCKGNYVLFVDSDDYVMVGNELDLMCKQASNNSLDVLDTPYLILEEGKETKLAPRKINALNDEIYTGQAYLQQIDILPVVAWNKLYRRTFILDNAITFKARKYEDICFTLEVLYKAKRVQNCTVPFYNYIIRPGSIMTSKPNHSSINDCFALCEDLEKLYLECDKNPQIEKSFFYSFVALANLLRHFEACDLKNEMTKKLQALHYKYRFYILKASKLDFKQRILLFISPNLMSIIVNKVRKS